MTVTSQSLKSELECHKNNSLLAQRKKKKESKGEIQISHKEVPPPACKSCSIKTERDFSALSIASYLWSWDLGTFCLISLVLPSCPSLWGRGQCSVRLPFATVFIFPASRLWRWKGSNPWTGMWELHQGGDSRTSYGWWPP